LQQPSNILSGHWKMPQQDFAVQQQA